MRKFVPMLLCMLCCSLSATQDKSHLDDMLSFLYHFSGEDRLASLEEMTLDSEDPYYADLVSLYVDESKVQANTYHIGNSLALYSTLIRDNNADSLYYYIHQAEPYLLESRNYKRYFQIKSREIVVLSREGKVTEVMELAESLKRLATEKSYPEGLEQVDSALGNYYFYNGMPEEGERLLADVLQRLIKRHAPLEQQLTQLVQLSSMVLSVESRLKYLGMMEELIDEIKKEDTLRLKRPLYLAELSMQRSYALTLAFDGQPEEARRHMLQYERIYQEHQPEGYHLDRADFYLHYHLYCKEYEATLPYIEELERYYRDNNLTLFLLEHLAQKAEVLTTIKHLPQAVDTYQELLLLNDSINRREYNESLANMRTKYEVEKLEMEKQQIVMESEQTRTQMMLLVFGCVLLLVVVATLIIVVRTTQRAKLVYKHSMEKAEEADQMKSAFLANMNHEIRTPLNAIVGFSQVLVDEEDKELRQEFATIIENNNELLQQLIGDVLDISKIESNSMSLLYSEQNLPLLMKDIYDTTRIRCTKQVCFTLDSCEELTLTTDKNRLKQVLTNLITNAFKHTASGEIKFGYTKNEQTILFYVKDTGEGIHKDQLESIFNRFTQLENGKKGVGLGLAISKGIVSKMNGRIWVESEVGKGSTFFVEVPHTDK